MYLINHAGAKTLTTERMIISGINSPIAGVSTHW